MNWNLTEEEAEHLYEDYFKDKYPHFKEVRPLLPAAYNPTLMHLLMANPVSYYSDAWTFFIKFPHDAPLMYRAHQQNMFHMPVFEHWKTALPLRMVEVLERTHEFYAALKDVKDRLYEYGRARYMIDQWPSSLRFFPDYVRKDMKVRQYVRAVPKSVTKLQPATLENLALMSVLEPYPETR